MNDMIKYEEVEKYVLNIRGQDVILDRDVAELYGVGTKEVNQAIKRNTDKFPEGYIIPLTTEEWGNLKSQFVTSSRGRSSLRLKNLTLDDPEVVTNCDHLSTLKYSKVLPSAFTEKGLYMLATILKSPRATQTTIAIVETFAKIRELSKTIAQLPVVQEEIQQKSLMQRSGEILAEILDDNALYVTGDETTIELNLALLKVKHTQKRGKRE